MKRGSEEINDETSPSPTHHEISTVKDIYIPLDLTVEMLKKLPAKSLVRFQCVSKQWSSIICRSRDFIDSIVTRSLAQPPRNAHFILHHYPDRSFPKSNNFFIFSSTEPQNTYKESVPTRCEVYQYVRGLIFGWSTGYPSVAAIYNSTTRQSLLLPDMEPEHFHQTTCLFGYDPLENQYKVVCISQNKLKSCQVFTLGDPTKEWRNIQCNVGIHFPVIPPVCINGIIYYRAMTKEYDSTTYALLSFDVRSEIFIQSEAPESLRHKYSTLINYQGKLGFIYCENNVEIWVMDNAEKKHEWSKIIFYEMEGFGEHNIAGATCGGEIVFIIKLSRCCKTLHVFYYDPKRNSLRYVEVEGTMVEETDHIHHYHNRIWAVMDHVENTMRL